LNLRPLPPENDTAGSEIIKLPITQRVSVCRCPCESRTVYLKCTSKCVGGGKMATRITQQLVASAKPAGYTVGKVTIPQTAPYDIRDTQVKGFILRVLPARKDKAFGRLFYVQIGRGKRHKIGDANLLTLTQSRAAARAALGAGADVAAIHRAIDQSLGRDRQEGTTLREFLAVTEDDASPRYGWWVVHNRKSGQATLARIKACFDARVSGKPLREITADVVDHWRTGRLQAGIKPETVNRDTTALKAALSKAVEWRLLETNPLADLRPIRVDRHKRAQRGLTPKEQAALVAALEAREARKRAERASANVWRAARGYPLMENLEGRYVDVLLPAVLISLNTGLRRQELFLLTWESVSLKKNELTVVGATAKTAQTRVVPLNGTVLDVLRRWQMQVGVRAGLVFPHNGRQFGNLKKSFYNALAEAGIDRADKGEGAVVWHSLRHTFGTRCAEKGVAPHVVKELMGHANLTTTQRYFHASREAKREGVKLLEV
jgi:integrase